MVPTLFKISNICKLVKIKVHNYINYTNFVKQYIIIDGSIKFNQNSNLHHRAVVEEVHNLILYFKYSPRPYIQIIIIEKPLLYISNNVQFFKYVCSTCTLIWLKIASSFNRSCFLKISGENASVSGESK